MQTPTVEGVFKNKIVYENHTDHVPIENDGDRDSNDENIHADSSNIVSTRQWINTHYF